MNQKKLFVIYIGGAHPQSLIELHDMRFVVAGSIEETYESLRQSWWGKPESLHLDAWGELHVVDGYRIKLSEKPSVSTEKLYFVNLGGYDKQQFTELHKNIFVVAQNDAQAKQKALQQVTHWEVPHRDYCHQIENILELNTLISNEQSYYLMLEKESGEHPFEFTCQYKPIGKRV